MKKNYTNIAIFFLNSILISNILSNNLGTNWWDKSLGKSISYELFTQWIGSVDSSSRLAMRNHVKNKNYNSILDIPCGLCFDYFGLKEDKIEINYYAIDICAKLVAKSLEKGIDVKLGTIESIEYPANSFDIVYSRHILEHLKSYQKAVSEIIRVAKKEVLIVFFIKPSESDNDFISFPVCGNHCLYHNTYSKNKLVEYILSNPKVDNIYWEDVGDKEAIAHILLKN